MYRMIRTYIELSATYTNLKKMPKNNNSSSMPESGECVRRQNIIMQVGQTCKWACCVIIIVIIMVCQGQTAKTCSKGYQTLSNIKAGSAPGQPSLVWLASSRGKMSSHKKHQTTGCEPMTAAIVASCCSCCADRGFCTKPNQLHAIQSPLQTCHINCMQINHRRKNAK